MRGWNFKTENRINAEKMLYKINKKTGISIVQYQEPSLRTYLLDIEYTRRKKLLSQANTSNSWQFPEKVLSSNLSAYTFQPSSCLITVYRPDRQISLSHPHSLNQLRTMDIVTLSLLAISAVSNHPFYLISCLVYNRLKN